jgi:hypothetical protein
METLYLKKLNGVEAKEQHQIKICNRYAAIENLSGDVVDINMAWESITENINTSAVDSLG